MCGPAPIVIPPRARRGKFLEDVHGKRAGRKNWPLRFRSLDPILSVTSFPLPGIECQPEGATSFRSVTPIAPANDWIRLADSGCLERRTNLLSPSVAHLPAFKVSQTAATSIHFAPFVETRQEAVLHKKFSTGYLFQTMGIRLRAFFLWFPIVETIPFARVERTRMHAERRAGGRIRGYSASIHRSRSRSFQNSTFMPAWLKTPM